MVGIHDIYLTLFSNHQHIIIKLFITSADGVDFAEKL